jgi:hypothetical protein
MILSRNINSVPSQHGIAVTFPNLADASHPRKCRSVHHLISHSYNKTKKLLNVVIYWGDSMPTMLFFDDTPWAL